MHPGSKVHDMFDMQVIQAHKSAFMRMIHEAVLIRNFKGIILNSKLEYHQCLRPSLETKSISRNPKKKDTPTSDQQPDLPKTQTLDITDFPTTDNPDFQAIIDEYESPFPEDPMTMPVLQQCEVVRYQASSALHMPGSVSGQLPPHHTAAQPIPAQNISVTIWDLRSLSDEICDLEAEILLLDKEVEFNEIKRHLTISNKEEYHEICEEIMNEWEDTNKEEHREENEKDIDWEDISRKLEEIGKNKLEMPKKENKEIRIKDYKEYIREEYKFVDNFQHLSDNIQQTKTKKRKRKRIYREKMSTKAEKTHAQKRKREECHANKVKPNLPEPTSLTITMNGTPPQQELTACFNRAFRQCPPITRPNKVKVKTLALISQPPTKPKTAQKRRQVKKPKINTRSQPLITHFLNLKHPPISSKSEIPEHSQLNHSKDQTTTTEESHNFNFLRRDRNQV